MNTCLNCGQSLATEVCLNCGSDKVLANPDPEPPYPPLPPPKKTDRELILEILERVKKLEEKLK